MTSTTTPTLADFWTTMDRASKSEIPGPDATLRLNAIDTNASATLRVGRGGPEVLCQGTERDLRDALTGAVSELALIARGQITLLGDARAVASLLDALPAIGARLATAFGKGGHRFAAIATTDSPTMTLPETITASRHDQERIAGAILARLSRTCQVIELDVLLPREGNRDDVPDGLVEAIANAASTSGSADAAAVAGVVHAPRPSRAAAALLAELQPDQPH